MSDTYFDLPSRLEDSFPEIDSDIVTDLRKNNEEYAEIQQQISELKKTVSVHYECDGGERRNPPDRRGTRCICSMPSVATKAG